jgi:hypothetical protein
MVGVKPYTLFLQSQYEYVCADPGRSAFGHFETFQALIAMA